MSRIYDYLNKDASGSGRPESHAARTRCLHGPFAGRLVRAVCTVVITLALSLCPGIASIAGYAEVSKPSDMSSEYWEQLNDSTIEWDEVEDLIKYWNPTYIVYTDQIDESVGTVWRGTSLDVSDLKDSMDEIDETISELRKAQKSLARTGDTSSETYEALDLSLSTALSGKKTIQSSLGSMGSTYRSLNYTLSHMDNTLSVLRYNLLQAVDGLIISYKTLEVNRELVAGQLELYGQLSTMYENMYAQGAATQSEVDSYRNQADTAAASLELIDNSMAQLKRNILQQCGYDPDADVTIADLPAADKDYLESRDYESDRTRAVNASSAVRDADVVSNYEGDVLMYRDASVAAAEARAVSAMDALKTELETEVLLCTASDTAAEIARIEAASADTKMSLGMLSKSEYGSLKLQYLSSDATAKLNELNLHQAIENYRFAVLGNLTVE